MVERGLLTPDQLRSSAWRRLYQGVYADAALPLTTDLRVAGARLLMPPHAVFSGRTAGHLLGAAELVDPEDPIEISVAAPLRCGPVRGLRVRHVASLPPADVRSVGRSRCTTGLRTALDIARCEPVFSSVPALDVLLASGVTGARQLRDAAGALEGRGARRAREAADLADARAESQPESRLRVVLALAGLRPVPQYIVRDADGSFVARVDLAFPEVRVAVEYDGAWHEGAGQLRKDRRRLNRLVQLGWLVVHVTAADMHETPRVVETVRGVLRSRNYREVGPRTTRRGPTSTQLGEGRRRPAH